VRNWRGVRQCAPHHPEIAWAESGHQLPLGVGTASGRFTSISRLSLSGPRQPNRAMCGRLRVGKDFLHVADLGRCSHVFGLFVRFT
jgi:hypothetical protein